VATAYGFQTVVEFSPRENILVASIGDSIGWQVVPAVNKLFIKPVASDAVTNMTVVTDQRTYYFNLIALKSETLGEMTYLVRFNYPEPPPVYEGLSTGPKNPMDLNFNYKIKQEKNSGLLRVFDDGQFTYLQFKNTKELPAIFVVGPDGKESLANFRVKEPYVVIERLANELVLRSGKEKTQVYNKGYSRPVQA
jgi:type IV secretion system protein VirB9